VKTEFAALASESSTRLSTPCRFQTRGFPISRERHPLAPVRARGDEKRDEARSIRIEPRASLDRLIFVSSARGIAAVNEQNSSQKRHRTLWENVM
jgi:hypothetical protein